MNNNIKEITLRTLENRRNLLAVKSNFNVGFLQKRIDEMQAELDSKQEYTHEDFAGIGVSVKVDVESHTKIINDFKMKLERRKKEIKELDEAINYFENL